MGHFCVPVFSPSSNCETRDAIRISRITSRTQRVQGNPKFNFCSRFTDISSKRKHSHSYKGRCLITSLFATLSCSPALSDRALSHFLVNPPVKRGMAAEPSFLCTFCWTPQFRPAKPKVIGREVRIACETCWKAVLDLSICWVCGEIVVRGEEVISLGWCFWHRGCFGCLLCGTGLDLPMKIRREVEELYSIDHSGDANSGYIDRLGKGRTQQQRGVELVRIPLCAWCDNATDGQYNGQVLEIGLQNVTKKDGGLSKSRLDMQWKTKYKPTAPLRRTTGTSTKEQGQVQKNEHEPEIRANLLARAGVLRVGEDGNADGMSDYSSPAESISPIPAPMYVSVLES